jgi:outer membrane protein insertion porin family
LIIKTNATPRRARPAAILLIGCACLPAPVAAFAQAPQPIAAAPVPNVAPPTEGGTVRSIEVRGAERVEPETVRSYVDLKVGDHYDREKLDQVLKALYDTELFADVTIRIEGGDAIVIEVRENPVVNRIIYEGAKRLKEDKLSKEVRLAPRQVFTRSKVAADVGRIIELYKRSGRFAAEVTPKLVQLEQNRVDVVFEIREGARSKVRQINIIGNRKFSEAKLRRVFATKQARSFRIFTSNDTYDPDRLAYDQQKLRQYYLTNGYADFRVVSAVAELTPDNKDFIITYVVDEGERYRFGDITLESKVRDIKADKFSYLLREQKGDWYNAQKVEDTINALTETAGLLGYAFADARPRFDRDKEKHVMNVSFVLGEAPRVYIERIDINGNTITKDEVVRREFRLAEGDAFNSYLVKRSRDRIQSLGFFQEKLEIAQKPGSGPDRVILEGNLEEKPTGQLQLSAGFSSLEQFLVNASIEQKNFVGSGDDLRFSVNYSSYATSVELGLTDPYFLGRNIALGGDIFRRDLSSFNYSGINNNRNTTYKQVTTGFQLRLGFPITEYLAAQLRYGLSQENVKLDRGTYYTDNNSDGIRGNSANDTCDPLIAGRYLCDAIGNRLTSAIGYSIAYDNLNNRLRPSAGQRLTVSQDLAGVGGNVDYLRTRADYVRYHNLGAGFIANFQLEGGYITPFAGDTIRLTDRFYVGQPRLRGFDIRGIGPRIVRQAREKGCVLSDPTTNCALLPGKANRTDDAIGGDVYYLGHLEVELPLGAGARELGLRPSTFIDFGGLGKTNFDRSTLISTNTFQEFYKGDSLSPRLSVGAGVSWNSPFGPFRIDLAKALLKQDGDNTTLFQFNVGGQF